MRLSQRLTQSDSYENNEEIDEPMLELNDTKDLSLHGII